MPYAIETTMECAKCHDIRPKVRRMSTDPTPVCDRCPDSPSLVEFQPARRLSPHILDSNGPRRAPGLGGVARLVYGQRPDGSLIETDSGSGLKAMKETLSAMHGGQEVNVEPDSKSARVQRAANRNEKLYADRAARGITPEVMKAHDAQVAEAKIAAGKAAAETGIDVSIAQSKAAASIPAPAVMAGAAFTV